jgi:plasmid maintenance system antidote protein VapI
MVRPGATDGRPSRNGKRTRITTILQGKRAITAETALRLARYFGTSPEFWMNLQTKYELDTAQDAAAARIEREVIPQSAA